MKRTLSFIFVLIAVCLFVSCTNSRQLEARKNLAAGFVKICDEKTQNTNYYDIVCHYEGTGFFEEICDFSFKDKAIDVIKTYLLVSPDDKEVQQLSVILNSNDEEFQQNLDSFKEKYPKSVLMEYIEFLNVAKKGQSFECTETKCWFEGLYPDFSLLSDFEKKYPESKYNEYLDILEVFYKLSDISPTTDSSVYGPIVNDFCEKYPESKVSEALKELDRYLILRDCIETTDYFSFVSYVKDNLSYYTIMGYITKCEDLIDTCNSYLDGCNDEIKYSPFYEEIEYRKSNIENAVESWNLKLDALVEKEADGIWSIAQYVDSYNEYTDQKYIRCTDITGIYSNLTVDRKEATLRFLINSEDSIDFKLYEQGTPVKGQNISNDYYVIMVKDDSGKEYALEGTNDSDRVSLDSAEESYTLHKLLMSNNKLRLSIERKTKGYQAQYSFTVDCKGYDRVFNRF